MHLDTTLDCSYYSRKMTFPQIVLLNMPLVIAVPHVDTEALNILAYRSFDVTVAQKGKSVLVSVPATDVRMKHTVAITLQPLT